jgi:hypothetical protein
MYGCHILLFHDNWHRNHVHDWFLYDLFCQYNWFCYINCYITPSVNVILLSCMLIFCFTVSAWSSDNLETYCQPRTRSNMTLVAYQLIAHAEYKLFLINQRFFCMRLVYLYNVCNRTNHMRSINEAAPWNLHRTSELKLDKNTLTAKILDFLRKRDRKKLKRAH